MSCLHEFKERRLSGETGARSCLALFIPESNERISIKCVSAFLLTEVYWSKTILIYDNILQN